MNTSIFRLAAITGILFFSMVTEGSLIFGQDDWSRWRGPNGNGIAEARQTPPIKWGEEENVIWKVKTPGRGHASPIVLGNRIFLATADETKRTQSAYCVDRKTGEIKWETTINEGEMPSRIHPNNSHASPTVATDGKRIFVVFENRKSCYLTALDLEGKKLWEQKVGAYVSRYGFGYGASPIVHAETVIVTNQNDKDSAMVAYKTSDGAVAWRTELPKSSSYSTPVVGEVDGKLQLLLSGQKKVASFNPDDGKMNWEVDASWEVTCGTLVWDDKVVYASGGYPTSQTVAVKGGTGKAEVVWENNQRSYEQSMLLSDGYLYIFTEAGLVTCFKASDGTQMWKERFGSGSKVGQSASPVLANGHLYITAESGETLVLKATPEKMVEVARNKLGDEAFASLALCGNQIFARYATYEGEEKKDRQEWLICIGEKKGN